MKAIWLFFILPTPGTEFMRQDTRDAIYRVRKPGIIIYPAPFSIFPILKKNPRLLRFFGTDRLIATCIDAKASTFALLQHEMSQKRWKCHKSVEMYCRKTQSRNNMTFYVELRHSHWVQLSLIRVITQKRIKVCVFLHFHSQFTINN
jgi:hypothetical protein